MTVNPSSAEEIIRGLERKSDKIRALSAAGYLTADIAKLLNLRYQHVWNVLDASTKTYSK
jgi:hypothetical protein